MSNQNKLMAGLLCFILFLLFYGMTARGDVQVTDEVAVFASAISLSTQGDLSIDELAWLQERVNIGAVGRGGHLYSKYFPGNLISAAAVYSLASQENDQPYLWEVPKNLNADHGAVELAKSNAGARAALKVNAFFGALGMTALFFLSLRYFDLKTSLAVVIFTGVCSDWWYQSRGFFSEVGAGAFLIMSLCFAAYQSPLLSGFGFGLSLLFRPTNLVALPMWGKTLWDKLPRAVWSGIFIAAAALGLLFFNWLRFDSIFNFGYGNERFQANFFAGLYGILRECLFRG